MTKFQIIVTTIFGLFLVGGILVFSAYRGSEADAVPVVIWGTLPSQNFTEILQNTSLYRSKLYKVDYVAKKAESFDNDLVEALASGQGPDIFMLPSDKIVKQGNKVFPIPYTVFTERQFKDAFIEGAEIYLSPQGTVALPFSVDPLVMYWNRQIFTDVRLTEPPKYWDEFYNLAHLISRKDGALNILRSAVAFGEFGNVTNAKEIIVNLAMQAGTPITAWQNGKIISVLSRSFDKPVLPAQAAVNFYTEFSNPAKDSYSWNRSLTNSANYFLGGDLALYFGFASELSSLQLRNPNLNFDVAPMPVSRDGGSSVTFGRFNALAITKYSKNPSAAFAVVSVLTDKDAAKLWSEALNLPPVRRDLLAVRQTNAYESVFYDAAIRAKAWLDPSPSETNLIFKNMIDSITSGRARVGEAIDRAERELTNLLN